MWDSDFCLEGGSLPHNDAQLLDVAGAKWPPILYSLQAHKREGLPTTMVPRRCDGRHVGAEGRGGSEKTDSHPQETTDLPAINLDKYRYFMTFPYISRKNALTP